MNRLAALFIATALPLAAAGPYQRLVSEHFEILAPRDAEAAAVLRELEYARAFFSQSAKLHSPHARLPLVFVPATSAQFARMRGPGMAYGFYVPLPGRDAIVLEGLDRTLRRAVIHEYTHLAVQYSGGRYPRWLGEGVAEYYSTLRAAVGGRAEYGHALPERVTRLRESPWFEIGDLVNRETQRRNATALSEDVFYAQSWLLVHMLISAERYRDGWTAFRDAISLKGASAAEAFDNVYKRSFEQVRDDLRAYFAAGRIEEQSTPMARPEVKIAVFEADGFDVEATTAGVEGWSGRKEEARRVYQKLVRASEEACKWQRELGDVAESAGLLNDALHHRRKDLDCRKDTAAACNLARGLGLHPSPAADLIALATEGLRGSGNCGLGSYWLGMRAYRSGRFPEAAALLEQARGLPDAVAVEVDQMAQDAARRGAVRTAPPTPPIGTAPPADGSVEVVAADDKPPLSRVEGVLEQAICTGPTARINVRGKVAVYTFYVEDRGKFDGLACGTQKRPVSVGFEQVKLPRVGSVAAVRELQFR